PLRVLLLDGPEGGGGGEEHVHAVLLHHPPEGARVGRAHGLALVEDGGGAHQERGVDDVGVPDDPPHVGGGPVHVARLHAVDVAHAPVEGDRVPTVVTDDPLGLAGGAGRVEDVQGVGGG